MMITNVGEIIIQINNSNNDGDENDSDLGDDEDNNDKSNSNNLRNTDNRFYIELSYIYHIARKSYCARARIFSNYLLSYQYRQHYHYHFHNIILLSLS